MIMKSFHDLITERRTIRRYTTEPVDPDHVRLILEAALMAPTSKSSRSRNLCVSTTLKYLSDRRLQNPPEPSPIKKLPARDSGHRRSGPHRALD